MELDAEVLIVGGGPAGLTAALTLARLSHIVKVFDNNEPRNHATSAMTMLIAHDGDCPKHFRDTAIQNLTSRHKNVTIEHCTIVKATKVDLDNGTHVFELEDDEGRKWTGKKLILSTGSRDIFPDIPGYELFWGNGIYHCYFYRGYTSEKAPSSGILAVDVMEDVMKSMHAARYATQISDKVTIYTNGNEELAKQFESAFGNATMFAIDSRKIKRFYRPEKAGSHCPTNVGIEFDEGHSIEESFIGHYPLSTARGNLHTQLGLSMLPTGDIVTNLPWLQTELRGVFAAGDNSQPRKIIPEATNSGSLVGAAVSNQIIAERFGQVGLV